MFPMMVLCSHSLTLSDALNVLFENFVVISHPAKSLSSIQ